MTFGRLFEKNNDFDVCGIFIDLQKSFNTWLATCARKPKVPGSSLAAAYVQW